MLGKGPERNTAQLAFMSYTCRENISSVLIRGQRAKERVRSC